MSATPDFPFAKLFPDSRQFRICLTCPFFCRMEERMIDCPWCELPLIAACACGRAIDDPSGSRCAACGKNLRPDPRLEQTREFIASCWRRH